MQGSVNLVTQQNLESYLTENSLYDYLWKKDISASFFSYFTT